MACIKQVGQSAKKGSVHLSHNLRMQGVLVNLLHSCVQLLSERGLCVGTGCNSKSTCPVLRQQQEYACCCHLASASSKGTFV